MRKITFAHTLAGQERKPSVVHRGAPTRSTTCAVATHTTAPSNARSRRATVHERDYCCQGGLLLRRVCISSVPENRWEGQLLLSDLPHKASGLVTIRVNDCGWRHVLFVLLPFFAPPEGIVLCTCFAPPAAACVRMRECVQVIYPLCLVRAQL